MLLCGILCTKNAFAQRLDDVGKKDPLSITGSIATSQTGYFASGISARRDPYNLYLSGNLNLDLYGWSVPLGFSFSNQSGSAFQQPFNQYGLSPTYKWITAHIGYSSMQFSDYTFSGHQFNGIGLELAPAGKFKFSALYGRLQKAAFADATAETVTAITPAYKRMAYGFKAAYGGEKSEVGISVFKARDILASNPYIEKNAVIQPQDNLAGGLNWRKLVLKKLALTGEVALSVLTRDVLAETDSLGNIRQGLLITNTSTTMYTAYKTGMAYNAQKFVIGGSYERVSPEYKTLGAYYFANDFENITANFTTRMLADKLSLAANTGLQRDDLRNTKQSRMKRFVGSATVTGQLSKKLNLNAGYSNFQSYINIKSSFNQINQLTPYDNLDTLNFTQIARNFNFSGNYIVRQDKQQTRMLNTSISAVVSADEQGGKKQETGGRFFNFNSSYSINFIPKNLSVSASLNANRNYAGTIRSTMAGPTVAVNKTFFEKKLRTSLSSSYNAAYANGQKNNSLINARFNSNYAIKKKHQLSLATVVLSRSQPALQAVRPAVREFTATFGYNYTF